MAEPDYSQVIAVDGSVASGKSSVSQQVAAVLGAGYFDTGVLYRTVSLAALKAGIDPGNADALAELAKGLDFQIGEEGQVVLDGQDVTREIRSREVEQVVTQIASHRAVREELKPLQRRIAGTGEPLVMVGRDIATVIVPDAGMKIFLDASPEVRARRRYEQRRQAGEAVTYDQILEDIKRRDHAERTRAVAPLVVADDAWEIDTGPLSFEEVVELITDRVRNQRAQEEASDA